MAHPVLPNDVMPVRPSVRAVVIAVTEHGFSYGTYSDAEGGRLAYAYAQRNKATVLTSLYLRPADFYSPGIDYAGEEWVCAGHFTTLG